MSVTVDGTSTRGGAGVNWAKDDHGVCFVATAGAVADRFTVERTATGMKRLISRLLEAGVVEVGIERGDGSVIEPLLADVLLVLMIAPNQLTNLRSRYRSTADNDDRYDAYVLADVVRRDRRRLSPLTGSTPATIVLRAAVRARRDLVGHRVAAPDQIRARRQIAFPSLAGLFAALDSVISHALLERFPTQTKAK